MEKWKAAYLNFGKKYPHLPKLLEAVFLVSFFCYLFCQMLMTTMFPTAFLMGLGGLALWFVIYATLAKTAVSLEKWRELLLALPVALICYMVSKNIQTSLLMLYAWAIIGMVGISYRKVAKIYVIVVGLIVMAAVFSALTGAIPNLVYLEEYGFRDSMGICYPTDFASYLFFLLLFFWIAWEKIPEWVTLILCVPMFWAASVLTQSDTSTICTILLGFVLLLFLIWKKFGEKSPLKKYKGFLDVLLVGSFPLAGLLMFLLIFLRAKGTSVGLKLDGWLTGRLTLAWNSLKANGIHPLGAVVSMRGRGGSTFPVAGYTFVDSSYPLLFIKYGWILTILLCGLWMWIVWKAVKQEDYRLAFGMALIAVHSLAEHHFIEAYYNILIVLPFASYNQNKEVVKTAKIAESPKASESAKASAHEKEAACLVRNFICLLSGVIILAAAPIWLSFVRTLCGWKELQEEGSGLGTALLGFVVLISFVFALVIGIFYLKKGAKKVAFLFGIAVALFLGGCLWLGLQFDQAKSQALPLLEADAKVVGKICDNASGKVYASELPTFYHQKFPKMSYHVFMGEDLARYRDVTVITSRQKEWNPCFQKGFSYVPISRDCAIYTNEANVIAALMQDGFSVYDYYPEKKLLKSGTELDLVKGKYTVTITLKMEEQEPMLMESDKEMADSEAIGGPDKKLAEINILGFGGREPILNEEILFRSLNQNEGIYQFEVSFSLQGDVSDVVFYLLKSGEIAFEVKDFYVQMTP